MEEIDQIKIFLNKWHYSNVKPCVALIDMDGTLYDSMGNHADAWVMTCKKVGFDCTREEFFLYEGWTGASTINLLALRQWGREATDDEKKNIYRIKTEYFNKLSAVAPMPGADELLSYMKKIGIRRVLVTGSGQSSLIDRLQTDFPSAFSKDMMVTSNNVTHGKPHPEPYIRGLELAGVAPIHAIAIENAPLGVESAAKAGIFTVGLTTGPISASELYKAGAAIVYPSMKDFADDFLTLVYNLFTTSV